MVETVKQLHNEFAELVVGSAMTSWEFDGEWAYQNLQISPKAKKAPAFFLASTTTVPDTEASAFLQVTDLRLPFLSFWIAYRWEAGRFASSEFAYFERQGGALKLAIYSRGDSKYSWDGKVYEFDGNTRLVGELCPVEQKCIGKAFEVLDTINQSTERDESAPSILVRQKLAKGGVPVRATRFINIYPSRPNCAGFTAGGSPKSPHSRRGHWRAYRSGKSVWVNDCVIRGGAILARNYSVLKV